MWPQEQARIHSLTYVVSWHTIFEPNLSASSSTSSSTVQFTICMYLCVYKCVSVLFLFCLKMQTQHFLPVGLELHFKWQLMVETMLAFSSFMTWKYNHIVKCKVWDADQENQHFRLFFPIINDLIYLSSLCHPQLYF